MAALNKPRLVPPAFPERGKSVTVGELIEQLAALGPECKDFPVRTWLPGSYIRLNRSLMIAGDNILIEGNLEPGSVLGA